MTGSPPERADAARNRRRVLEAAARVMAEDGVEKLSPDRVARAAGVGVGTVYRRFGGRAELAGALLADRVRELRERTSGGPPPLGPGAAPAARLRAFMNALTDLVCEELPLLLYAESTAPAGGRYRTAAYQEHHAHITGLLTEAGHGQRAGYLADLLLAATTPSLIARQRTDGGLDAGQIKEALDDTVGRLAS